MSAPFPRPLTLPATDGFPLGAHVFDPEARSGGPARAVAVIHGATGVPQRFYRHFAGFLASRGLRVLTYDYRGVGASRPESHRESLREFRADMTDWGVRDFGGALAWARKGSPELPLVLVGHSFGGQAFGLTEVSAGSSGSSNVGTPAAVFVTTPSGYFRHWHGTARWRLGLLWHVGLPLMVRVFGHLPGRLGFGEDLPRGVALEWARWCRTPGYLVPHVPGAAERFRSFRGPLLSWSFGDDGYAPRPAVEALLARFENAGIERRHLEGGDLPGGRVGHFGFFRTGATEALWRGTVQWARALWEGR